MDKHMFYVPIKYENSVCVYKGSKGFRGLRITQYWRYVCVYICASHIYIVFNASDWSYCTQKKMSFGCSADYE